MEQQLFTWESFDELGTDEYEFYNVTTVVKIKDIPAGTHFDMAQINFGDYPYVSFQNDGNILHSFSLRLFVV